MAIRKSILLMTNTGTNWDVIGEPVRADAYYGYTDGLMTVQVVYQNFVGGFGIQATLALDPQPQDWFWVKLTPELTITMPFITYPQIPLAPTGSNGGDTGSQAFTFQGNYVFLRAVLNREFIQPAMPPSLLWQGWTYGQIDKVLLSL